MAAKMFIIALIVCTAHAATWIDLHPPKPPTELAHKEGCYIPEINDVIPYGAEITPNGTCVRVTCAGDTIDYDSCGVVGWFGNCHETGEDYSKPYPMCCPRVICGSDNVIE